MKKAIPVVFALLLLLSACGEPPSSGENKTIRSLDSDRSFSHAFTNLCETEDTVYFAVNDQSNFEKPGDFAGYLLYYMDKATGIFGPLCGRPECQHNDEDCNAFMSTSAPHGLSSYDGRLYWIGDEWTGTSLVKDVYSIAYDGTDRRTERELDGGLYPTSISGTTVFQFHQGHVYIAAQTNSVVDGEAVYMNYICAYPLDPDEEGFVILNEQCSPSIKTQLYRDSLYIMTDDSSGDRNKLIFRRWDVESHEMETVFSGEVAFEIEYEFWATDDGILLAGYVVTGTDEDGNGNSWEDSVYFYDFTSGEFSEAYPYYPGKDSLITGFTDGLFIVKTYKDNEIGIIAMDFAGQAVLDATFNTNGWPSNFLGSLQVAGADEKYIYLYNFDSTVTYAVAVPLDGGEPTIMWNGNT